MTPQHIKDYCQKKGLTNPRASYALTAIRWLATEPDGSVHLIPNNKFLAIDESIREMFEEDLSKAAEEAKLGHNFPSNPPQIS